MYIEIVTLPDGRAAASDYWFGDGRCIRVGEVAYIPDESKAVHLATGVVREVAAAAAAGRVVNADEAPRPGRKPNEDRSGA